MKPLEGNPLAVFPDASEFDDTTKQKIAKELNLEEKVSFGRAAELCQTPLAAFLDFAAKHAVPPLRYSFDDLEEERRTADRLEP